MPLNDDGLFGPRFNVAMLVGGCGWEGDRGLLSRYHYVLIESSRAPLYLTEIRS